MEHKEWFVKFWVSMAAQTIAETAQKILTPETLRYAAKQSARCLVVPVRLRRAIKKYLRGPLLSWCLIFFSYMQYISLYFSYFCDANCS